MRVGQDRHDLGSEVVELVFPEGTPVPFGIELGTPLSELAPRLPAPKPDGHAQAFEFSVSDPLGAGRRVVLKIHQQLARAHIVTVCFFSKEKIDVDAPYRVMREHLEASHGKPGKETGGVLKFVYTLKGTTYPGVITICRYKDAQQENVLELGMRVADGVRFQGTTKPRNNV